MTDKMSDAQCGKCGVCAISISFPSDQENKESTTRQQMIRRLLRYCWTVFKGNGIDIVDI